jgi:hypothetical protein
MKFTLSVVFSCGLLSAQSTDAASGGEARAIVGLQQAGASAAKANQNFFVDFFIDRKLAASKWSLWGEIRIASTPRQISTPVSQFTFAAQAAGLKVNELAESAAFSTGLDFHPWSWTVGQAARRIGFVLSLGASAPFDPISRISLFQVPARSSPQYNGFAAAFPAARDAAYIGFVPPDRRQFFRAWSAGIRLTTIYPQSPPATYTITFGQDEAVTGGRLTGAVGNFDVFYPLPVKLHSYRYLYLFCNASLRVTRAEVLTPFDLSPAPATITGSETTVAIVPIPSNRDVYRIGIGVDAIALLSAIWGR